MADQLYRKPRKPRSDVMDLTGQIFGRLTVVSRAPGTRARWFCTCACGANVSVRASNLRSKTKPTRSCGCLRDDKARTTHRTHGLSDHPLYRVWVEMIRRCEDPKSKDYRHYGGRGISVSADWHDVACFIQDMYVGYKKGLQIDRMDNNLGYSKDNCRWATCEDNRRNTRINVLNVAMVEKLRGLKAEGRSGVSLANEYGLNYSTLSACLAGKTWKIGSLGG